jgi:hypothetical protein
MTFALERMVREVVNSSRYRASAMPRLASAEACHV